MKRTDAEADAFLADTQAKYASGELTGLTPLHIPDPASPEGFTPTWLRWYVAADGQKVMCHYGAVTDLAYGEVSMREFHAQGKPPHPVHGGFQWGIACTPSSRTIMDDGDHPDEWGNTAAGRYLGPWQDVATSVRVTPDGTVKFHVAEIVPPELVHLWPKQEPVPYGHLNSNGLGYVEGQHASGTAYAATGKPWVVADEALMRAHLEDNGGILHTASSGAGAAGDDYATAYKTWTDPEGRYPAYLGGAVLGNWKEGTRNDSLPARCGVIKAAGGQGSPGMGTLFGELCAEYDAETGRGDGHVYRAFGRAYLAWGKAQQISQDANIPAGLTAAAAARAASGMNGHGQGGTVAAAIAGDPGSDDDDDGGDDGDDGGNAGVAAGRPRKPGLDPLTDLVLKLFGFARDTGGELFVLPGPLLPGEPYIPRSFLGNDVKYLANVMWRGMAETWNGWVWREYPDADDQKKAGVVPVSKVPSDTTVNNGVHHLEALGMTAGRAVTAALRAVEVTADGGRGIVLDLGDSSGRVAWITAAGWQVADPRTLPFPPPVFRRSTGYLPLPEPVRGGTLDELWTILRVTDETAKNLITGWLAGVFFAGASRPGLWLTGPPGAGKTTLGGALARLADGTEWLDGRLDKSDERNNIIRAAKHYVVSFDNMTAVTADVSDWIATLVTGHRDTFRKMRTNFDDVSMAYKRTFVATGLSLPYGFAADALERIIEVECAPITDARRVNEDRMRTELDEARPRLLGALLDHVASVLAKLALIGGDDKGAGLTRMNQYAQVLIAHDAAYGTGCLAAYLASVKRVREDKAEAEPVAAGLIRLWENQAGARCQECETCTVRCGTCAGCKAVPPMACYNGYQRGPCRSPGPPAWCQCPGCKARPRAQCAGYTWEGTAAALLAMLPRMGADGYWPSDGRALGDKLTALDGVLSGAGFRITRRRSNGQRLTRITRKS